MNRADRRRAKAHMRKLSDRAVAALAFHAVRGEDPGMQLDFVERQMLKLGREVPPDLVALATDGQLAESDLVLPFGPKFLKVAGIADVWP